MGIIKLNNIRTFSFHGCLVEESKIGSNYRVDLTVKTDLKKSAETDNLNDTVDYVHLNKIVKDAMAIRSKLLEHVAKRIIDTIFDEIKSVSKVNVTVSKLNPPIGGDVESVEINMKAKRP
uniref:dihydroneopterin aldolase n=1 Tax=Flavobacterium sp. TaxID=239 RepID=UPI00404B6CD1